MFPLLLTRQCQPVDKQAERPMMRLFNTDTTSFLALESSFAREKSQPIDPAASEIGATLFDAIVNARTLDLLVAVESANESVKSRLSDSYKYLKAACDKYDTLGIEFAERRIISQTHDNQQSLVTASINAFCDEVESNHDFLVELIKWKDSNTHLVNNRFLEGGFDTRWNAGRTYSTPAYFLTENRRFVDFCNSRPALSIKEWSYCFDFLMKHGPYLAESSGIYVPHTLRAYRGSHILTVATAAKLTPRALPIQISFYTSVKDALETRAFSKFEHFIDCALRCRHAANTFIGKTPVFELDKRRIENGMPDFVRRCETYFPATLSQNAFGKNASSAGTDAVTDTMREFIKGSLGKAIEFGGVTAAIFGDWKSAIEVGVSTIAVVAIKDFAKYSLVQFDRKYFAPTGVGFEVEQRWQDKVVRKLCHTNQLQIEYSPPPEIGPAFILSKK
jgi:hypothetical protein